MMSDVDRYIENRQKTDPDFAEGFESGYFSFKIGVMLAQAREEAGMTQEEIARRLKLNKSTISRIENHAEEVGLFLLKRYARAVGKQFCVEIK